MAMRYDLLHKRFSTLSFVQLLLQFLLLLCSLHRRIAKKESKNSQFASNTIPVAASDSTQPPGL